MNRDEDRVNTREGAEGIAPHDKDGRHLELDPEPFEHEQDTQATHINAEDELIVPVAEEELTARRREVDRGEVRIRKDVTEEQRTIDVPVVEEEVELTRRRVDRPVTDASHAFEEDTITVPVRGEEVNVEKTTRVIEEIDIDKTPTTRTERVSDAVRREEVRIEGDDVDIERRRDGVSKDNAVD